MPGELRSGTAIGQALQPPDRPGHPSTMPCPDTRVGASVSIRAGKLLGSLSVGVGESVSRLVKQGAFLILVGEMPSGQKAGPRAERRVIRALAEEPTGLDDEWCAIPSFHLNGVMATGEVDLVLLHRIHGVVFLEVKSGQWRWEKLSKGRTRADVVKGGIPTEELVAQQKDSGWTGKKDPFKQCKAAEDWLFPVKNQLGLGSFPVSSAVWLPEMKDLPKGLSDDLADRILLEGDLSQARKAIFDLLKRVDALYSNSTPGAKGTRRKANLSYGQFERLRQQFGAASGRSHPDWLDHEGIQAARDDIAKPSEGQSLALKFLQEGPRKAVLGRAGSGKTTLALKEANRLLKDSDNPDCRIAFVCSNAILAADVKSELEKADGGQGRVSIIDLASLRLPRDGSPPAHDSSSDEFPHELAAAGFDHVILDDAHLFLHQILMGKLGGSGFDPLDLLKSRFDGSVKVFMDPRQTPRAQQGTIPLALEKLGISPTDTLVLKRNHRSTEAVDEACRALVGEEKAVGSSKGQPGGSTSRVVWRPPVGLTDRMQSAAAAPPTKDEVVRGTKRLMWWPGVSQEESNDLRELLSCVVHELVTKSKYGTRDICIVADVYDRLLLSGASDPQGQGEEATNVGAQVDVSYDPGDQVTLAKPGGGGEYKIRVMPPYCGSEAPVAIVLQAGTAITTSVRQTAASNGWPQSETVPWYPGVVFQALPGTVFPVEAIAENEEALSLDAAALRRDSRVGDVTGNWKLFTACSRAQFDLVVVTLPEDSRVDYLDEWRIRD